MTAQEIKPGQVWVERTKRKEYAIKRELRVRSVGSEEFSHQPGRAEITLIRFEILKRWTTNEWERSNRPMTAFGLRKNWVLKEDA